MDRHVRAQPSWDYPWKAADLCPCGSELAFGRCCLQRDGRPYLRLGSILPPGEPTGYAHPRCYLASSCNCSTAISREHYVSRGMIAGPELKVQGMPWQAEPVLRVSPDALTSKVLCRRHNQALSPLDEHALRAFREVGKARDHATRRSLSRRPYAAILSGEALELWALKTMAGFYASGMEFMVGPRRFRDAPPPMAQIAEILTSPRPRALVSLDIPAEAEAHEASLGRSAVSIIPLYEDGDDTMSAFMVRMHGLGFKFHFKDSGTAQDASGLVRPHMVDLIGPLRKSRLYLGWPDAVTGRYVLIRLRQSDATPRERPRPGRPERGDRRTANAPVRR